MKIAVLMLSVGFLVAMIACDQNSSEDQRFETQANGFIEQLLTQNPEWATYLGDHRFDNKLSDYSPKGIAARQTLYAGYLDSLKTIDPAKLSATNAIDYGILVESIRGMKFRLDSIRSHEWNPRNYNVGGAIYGLLAREFAPLEQRLESLKERMKLIPGLLEQAKANLQNPPKVHTETAILQNKGTINLVKDELNQYLDKVPGFSDAFKPLQEQTVAVLEQYGHWLESDLLPRSNGEFRLGEKKYREKLKYSIESDMTPEEILARAEKDLVETHAAIYETALPLFKQYFPEVTDEATLKDRKKIVRTVLDRLAEDHPDAENIVTLAEQRLAECTEFVRSHDLMTLPDEPVNIIVMPEFQRGVAVAYCDSPGPLEKHLKTFYAISPPPADWDDARVESYFREYNNHMLIDLTVHEAMPGHYLQIAHANDFKAPTLIRSIFGSGPFVEGWATYTEQLMVEFGHGGPELKMQQLKMRLRMIINAIIDQKIHMGDMSESEAMDLMVKEGFQEEGEAAGKWRRACLGSTQLSTYYVGNIAINDIRRAYEEKHGENTDLKAFHDELLSFGSPPVKYIRELMDL